MHGISSIKKILIILCVANVLIIGAYAYVYFSIQKKLTYIEEKSVEVKQTITDKKNEAIVLKILEEKNSEREKIQRQFVAHGKEVDFAVALESLADKSGIEYTYELRSEDPSEKDPKNKLPYTLLHVVAKTEGSWSNLFRFLSFIESYERYISVNTFELSTVETGEENSESLWRGAFSLTAYVAK